MKTFPFARPFAPLLFCAASFAGIFTAAAEPPPALPAPTPAQIAWADAAVGIFVHRGPQTVQGREIDNLSIPAERIVPDRFDAAKIEAVTTTALRLDVEAVEGDAGIRNSPLFS